MGPKKMGKGGGRTNERPKTDQVTLGPVKGLKKLNVIAHNHRQTGDRHADMATL